jgi:hypothetical protein
VLRGIERNRATVRAGWDSHLMGFLGWIAPAMMPALLEVVFRRQLLGQLDEPPRSD